MHCQIWIWHPTLSALWSAHLAVINVLVNMATRSSRAASSSSSMLPARGSFSSMMVSAGGSSSEGGDDERTSAFEYLPEDQVAPSPPPPPSSPPAAPEIPFRANQRVRVKSVSFPLDFKDHNPKSQSVRRATGVRTQSPPKARERRAMSTVVEQTGIARGSTSPAIHSELEVKAQAGIHGSPKSKSQEVSSAKSLSSIPTPSLHPVDTLAKKLRQQANELTQMYEQLSTQREQIESYKKDVELQKLENGRLKLLLKHHRQDGRATAGITPRRKTTTLNTPVDREGRSSCQSAKSALDRKIQEMEEEKRHYELSAKRLENVVTDVQSFFEQRNQREGNEHGSEIEEQRQYIRVLEEVVHLKAREFNISSHEELLVVLAELRHTIYERERDVEQLRQQLHVAEEQLLREKQSHLESREAFERQHQDHDEFKTQARSNESMLKQQLMAYQRDLYRIRDDFNQEQSKWTSLQEHERQLEHRLAKVETEAASVRARLQEVVRERDAVGSQLTEAKKNADTASHRASQWEDEANRRQIHLDEMNALHEELLKSVTETSGSNEALKSRTIQLENELATFKQRTDDLQHELGQEVARNEAEQIRLTEQMQVLTEQCNTFDVESKELMKTVKELGEMLEMTRNQLADKIDELEEAQRSLQEQKRKASVNNEAAAEMDSALAAAVRMMTPFVDTQAREEDCDTLDMYTVNRLEACCGALRSLLDINVNTSAPSSCVMPHSLHRFLQGISEVAACAVSDMMHCRDSWNKERCDLHDACRILEESCRVYSIDLEQCHHQLSKCKSELSERTLQVEVVAIEMEALANQILSMQAVHSDNCVLQERMAELEECQKRFQTALADTEQALQVQQDENEDLQQKLLVVDVELKQQQSMLSEHSDLQLRVVDLAGELDEALTLSEEQNAWNEQLSRNLQRQEVTTATQNAIIRELKAQHRAFARRFTQLFERYADCEESSSVVNFARDAGINEIDTEILLQQLQAFPAVVEQYVGRCMSHVQSEEINTAQANKITTAGWYTHEKEAIVKTVEDACDPTGKVAANMKQVECGEETAFQEQLELIRDAFRPYRLD